MLRGALRIGELPGSHSRDVQILEAADAAYSDTLMPRSLEQDKTGQSLLVLGGLDLSHLSLETAALLEWTASFVDRRHVDVNVALQKAFARTL